MIAATWYSAIGPLYTINKSVETSFMFINALIVFAFIMVYMNIFLKLILNYDEKLTHEAETDLLTAS